MTKMIKMSLIAAVAVTGMTTVNAQPLEEAIKGVDVSGYVRLRHNTTYGEGTAADAKTNEQKFVLDTKTKVNDIVTANVKIMAAGGAKADDLDLNQANFIINNGYTAIVGKQTTQSPFAANNGDTVSHGLTVLVPVSGATLAFASYNDATSDNVVDADSLNAVAVIGKVAGVNLEAWVLANETGDRFSALMASTKISNVSVSAHYADKKSDVETTSNDEVSNAQVVAATSIAGFDVYAAYATTGKDSGNVSVDSDVDGRILFSLASETISTATADVNVAVVGASTTVAGVKVGLDYLSGEAGSADLKETLVSASYPLSKNFIVSGWYSSAEVGTTDTKKSRLEAIYKF